MASRNSRFAAVVGAIHDPASALPRRAASVASAAGSNFSNYSSEIRNRADQYPKLCKCDVCRKDNSNGKKLQKTQYREHQSAARQASNSATLAAPINRVATNSSRGAKYVAAAAAATAARERTAAVSAAAAAAAVVVQLQPADDGEIVDASLLDIAGDFVDDIEQNGVVEDSEPYPWGMLYAIDDDPPEPVDATMAADSSAAAAAAAISPPPADIPVNRGGRPHLKRPDLDSPCWRIPASSTESTASIPLHSLGNLMNDLLRFSSEHHLTDVAGKELFELWQKYLPGTTLPHYRQSKQIAEEDAPTERKQFAVCSDDCRLRALANLSPEALNELRAAVCDNCGKPLVENKAFVKTFTYLGVKPRLTQMLQDPTRHPLLRLPIAGVLTSLDVDNPAAPPIYREPLESDSCSTLAESPGWWKYVHQARTSDNQQFGADPYNIVLSLGVDAAQPYNRGGLSITPLLLQVLNLPENHRHLGSNMILAGVIPGKKASTTSEGVGLANLNTYIEPLVDELLALWYDGLDYICPIDKISKNIRVKLLFTVCDYPGHAKLNCQQHQGAYYGCQKCDIQAERKDNRMAYLQFNDEADRAPKLTHAAYILRAKRMEEVNSKLVAQQKIVNQKLTQLAAMEKTKEDTYQSPYEKKRMKQAIDQLKDQVRVEKAKLTSIKKARDVEQTASCSVKGMSQLSRLPYFDMVEHTVLDMMHITQGVVSAHLVQLLKGKRTVAKKEKSKKQPKKSAKVRRPAAAAPPLRISSLLPIDEAIPMELDEDERKQPAAAAAAAVMEQKDDETEFAGVELEDEEDEDEDEEEEENRVEDVPELLAPPPADVDAIARLKRHARFCIAKHRWKELESGPYAKIQAPTGVAPASKHPLTKTGEMTAHHWVNFVRCYGKYLLQQAYDTTKVENAETLEALCRILDFIALCLRSHVTMDSKQETDDLLPIVEQAFRDIIPTTEHAIVVHLLLRHIPDTIKLWGPVRSYWCFPFERMLGRLCSTIAKTKKHPEKVLVNKYCMFIAASALSNTNEEEEEDDEPHPLVPLGAVSALNKVSIAWPSATGSYVRSVNYHSHLKSADRRGRILEPILGKAVCDCYQGRGSDFTMYNYKTAIQIGRWKFNIKLREDNKQNEKTRASWFSIRAKHVPHYNIRADVVDVNSEQLVYGRIAQFAQLTIPGWRVEPFLLAEVTLFAPKKIDPISRYPIVDFNEPLTQKTKADFPLLREDPDAWPSYESLPLIKRAISYIQVQFIESMVSLAPCDIDQPRGDYFVLPLAI